MIGEQRWNLAIVLGAIVGGFIAYHFMMDSKQVLQLNPTTVKQLQSLHIDAPNGKLGPDAIFGVSKCGHGKDFITFRWWVFNWFCTPYAGGCTSGHAISGLSNTNSLVNCCYWFFIGGLIAAHF